ncbi:DUF3820 family protein [Escherichia coli]|nr:DUF3820 family protein [Escherichia coli]
MEKEQLIEIANTIMPFGKYKGRRLIDLPEEYLLWFARKDEFPAGKLGELMQITLLIKTEGLTQLVQPLKLKADASGADATGPAPEASALSFRGAAFLLRL